MARGGRQTALSDQRPELRALQDLRHQGSEPEHRLGRARGWRRPELFRHVSGCCIRGERGKETGMPADKLDPDAQRVCELMLASGRPAIQTLTTAEARAVFLASKAILQPDPEAVAEVRDLTADGPAAAIPLRLYRGQSSAGGKAQPVLV